MRKCEHDANYEMPFLSVATGSNMKQSNCSLSRLAILWLIPSSQRANMVEKLVYNIPPTTQHACILAYACSSKAV
ncbi:hypothetical protein T01_5856 [Trichinella spiralis]|uniref:Uncharacterized protein n=1 Tax=Trichinella spiralis TaxID=6334 RepID=A0A0V1BRF8_TRISP|nr:hypothetical protein T01_5856 [Trichinella spiralis]